MKMNKLNENTVSALGFGAMRLPTKDGKIDYEHGTKMIDRAMEAGINYYDTAWFYHQGESEVFLKKALVERYPRDSFFLATKLPYGDCNSAESAYNDRFKVQLERTGAGYFDYYLLHGLGDWGWKHCKETGIDKMFFGLKEKGLVKHTSFSFHDSPEVLDKILSETEGLWDFVQIQLNYFDWTAIGAEKMYNVLVKHNVPVVVMEPVRGGNLAMLNDEIRKVFLDADPDASTASWALRFAATLPNVKVVLSGMSNLDQLDDNIKTFTDFKPIEGKDKEVLNKALEVMNGLPLTGCTGCKYCTTVCPKELDIPSAFRLYDGYIRFNNPGELNYWYLQKVPEEKQAPECIGCESCIQKCPQHLNIPELLKSVHAKALQLK